MATSIPINSLLYLSCSIVQVEVKLLSVFHYHCISTVDYKINYYRMQIGDALSKAKPRVLSRRTHGAGRTRASMDVDLSSIVMPNSFAYESSL